MLCSIKYKKYYMSGVNSLLNIIFNRENEKGDEENNE